MNKEEIHTILKNRRSELKNKFGVTDIGLFGSFARDEAVLDSDIDIVVELEHPNLFLLASLKYYLEEIFNKNVDVVRLRNDMDHSLKNRIKDEALFV